MNFIKKHFLWLAGGVLVLWYFLTRNSSSATQAVNPTGDTSYPSPTATTGSVFSALPALYNRALTLGIDPNGVLQSTGLFTSPATNATNAATSSLGLGSLTGAAQQLASALTSGLNAGVDSQPASDTSGAYSEDASGDEITSDGNDLEGNPVLTTGSPFDAESASASSDLTNIFGGTDYTPFSGGTESGPVIDNTQVVENPPTEDYAAAATDQTDYEDPTSSAYSDGFSFD